VVLHYLVKRGNMKIAFFTQMLYLLPEFNQVLNFFNLFDSQLILTLLYDSLNPVINAFISGCWGARFRINEVEGAAEVGLCCTYNAPMAVFWVSSFAR